MVEHKEAEGGRLPLWRRASREAGAVQQFCPHYSVAVRPPRSIPPDLPRRALHAVSGEYFCFYFLMCRQAASSDGAGVLLRVQRGHLGKRNWHHFLHSLPPPSTVEARARGNQRWHQHARNGRSGCLWTVVGHLLLCYSARLAERLSSSVGSA